MWRDDRSVGPSEADVASAGQAKTGRRRPAPVEIPYYLPKHYSWAYVTPEAVERFEQPWIIDLILWGNYARLSNAVRRRLDDVRDARVLQIACAYGDFTPGLARHVADRNGRLDVIDVLPVQLANLNGKLGPNSSVALHRMDSAALEFEADVFDATVLFLLLHEQPEPWRRKTLAEAWRVTRPGGRIVLVDYAKPAWWNPLRYVMGPILALLEPFALELWRRPIADFAPTEMADASILRSRACGGLYQILTISKT